MSAVIVAQKTADHPQTEKQHTAVDGQTLKGESDSQQGSRTSALCERLDVGRRNHSGSGSH
jgi:hypothetical protein